MLTDEKHFNDLQHKTRAIASTWILAGFGGIAYFIKTMDPVFKYFSTYTMINLVSLMVVIGLFILWILDQLVYQRLLNANFVAGLYSEFVHDSEPPIRTLMIIGSEYRGMARFYNLFYFIPMVTFTVFGASAWMLELTMEINQTTTPVSVVIGMILMIITFLIWSYIFSKKRATPFYNLLQAFDNPEFEQFGTASGCRELVSRWRPITSNAGDVTTPNPN